MKKILKKLDPKLCRVCGLEHSDYPWGEDGDKPTFEICACCGVEFGLDDATPTVVRRSREKWMAGGYAWFNPGQKPDDWKPDEQVARLKDTAWDPWG